MDDVPETPVIETPQSEESCENNDNEELDTPELSIPAPVLRRSSRPHVPNRKYLNYILLTDEGEPENYEEACQMTDASKWELAMKDEMKSLMSNQTWELVLARSESCDVSLPAVNDPFCLTHMGEGHSVSFIVPKDRDMKAMTLCVVYLSNPKIIEPEFTTIVIVNYTKCSIQIHNHGTVISFQDKDWHSIMSNLESGDNVEIFVSFGNGLVVKNTTMYLICGESKNMEKASELKKLSLIRFIKKVVSHPF
ncbi:hypothetical protein V8G54_010548 [Vigna mungo]|uniref:Retrovirus-related Pol polyprotein from transposon TNT 1-94 n=1 Tax=Vigna mungo TaxID=3915 RepID=A0AAQ3S6H7_VIGMU